MAEVSRLVEILVAYFVRAFAAPTSGSLVESFPLPACVDPPGTLHSARSASIHPGLLAIVTGRQAAKARTSRSSVELGRAMAGFSPWPRAVVGPGAVCSFPVGCYPVQQKEEQALREESSMRRESVVERMKLHRDWQTRAVVKA